MRTHAGTESGEGDPSLPKHIKDREEFPEISGFYALQDPYLTAGEEQGGYTWSNRSWLDRLNICLSDSMTPLDVNTIDNLPYYAPVILYVKRNLKQTGKGFWKMNVSAMEKLQYNDGIRSLLQREKTAFPICMKW